MLELRHIDFSVKEEGGKKPAKILSDISLTFPEKSITVITGQNGSGKSTLIKLITGLERPTAGQIIYNGRNITSLSVTERARLGFTTAFQQPVRFKGITVKKLLDIACGKQSNLGQLCEYLSQVGLCARNYIDRELDGSLSGGEAKRIELAMAIAKGGDVFLLDEPEAGIDLWSFSDLTNLFASLRDKTVLIVSHQSKIMEIADNIVLLDKESAPVTGTREEMLPGLQDRNGVCAARKGV